MKLLTEFRQFAMRGNVVDMAVGVIIGGAFGKIISSLVNDVLMPPLGLLVGNIDLSDRAWVLRAAQGESPAVRLSYGLFINNIIGFVIMAFAMFMVIKGMNNLAKKPAPPTPTTKECPQCMSTIHLRAVRCAHCASPVSA